ncbi:3'(2'),5'-bisphosphate nucleotidase CysQ [Endothiovibrio diazotrophicus]
MWQPTPEALEALIEPVVAVAHAAGREILRRYEGEVEVTSKSDNTPLTAADLAAHEALVAGLGALSPALPLLSEESAEIPFDERAGWPSYWLADPLDGTRHFIRRDGEFCVCIALIHQHRPLLGVIHAPLGDTDYFARLGGGAWCRTADGATRRLASRRPAASPPTVATGRFHRGPALETLLERLGEHRSVTLGSALKSCLVAAGEVDLYARLGPTSEWDTAAAQILLEEAGGALVDTDLQPLRYNTRPELTNPHFLAVGDPAHDWSRYLPD